MLRMHSHLCILSQQGALNVMHGQETVRCSMGYGCRRCGGLHRCEACQQQAYNRDQPAYTDFTLLLLLQAMGAAWQRQVMMWSQQRV
jgi:hypothetical protein